MYKQKLGKIEHEVSALFRLLNPALGFENGEKRVVDRTYMMYIQRCVYMYCGVGVCIRCRPPVVAATSPWDLCAPANVKWCHPSIETLARPVLKLDVASTVSQPVVPTKLPPPSTRLDLDKACT
ncbi:hypothetical protein Nepgr_016929 [Nepenthes gracilis]|uniref:Uncharacterized protein n=1 Tax=Nepenthes gracilis TaxID=150966 RepID=A0AAD3XS14_NEPGR|nr:hypothetical protein Nepgr_016929 [Nepenthes gracilis]